MRAISGAKARRLVMVAATMGLAVLFWRRRTTRRRGEGGGGGDLAGDREPRNPVPPTLVDAGVAVPGV